MEKGWLYLFSGITILVIYLIFSLGIIKNFITALTFFGSLLVIVTALYLAFKGISLLCEEDDTDDNHYFVT